MPGTRFGRWTVLAEAERTTAGKRRALCRCDCGSISRIDFTAIKSGRSQSCGCLAREVTSALSRKHGQSMTEDRRATAEYVAWAEMIKRCENSKSKSYVRYGGRGIRVCDRWRNDFSDFLADMGPRPSARHSLDRRENSGNYEPSNCRWATAKEQSRNRRTSRRIAHNGETKTLAEWAEVSGLNPLTLRIRIHAGWSMEDALSRPLRVTRRTRIEAESARLQG
jgi:hypothetical protein